MNYDNWYEDEFNEEYEADDDFDSDEEQEEIKTLFDDEEEFKSLGRQAIQALSKCKDSDYELNPKQYTKFVAVCAYFTKLAKANGGKVSKIKIEPHMENQCIEVSFKEIHLDSEELKKFNTAISMCCTVEFEPNLNGETEFGVVVPDVFVRKSQCKEYSV